MEYKQFTIEEVELEEQSDEYLNRLFDYWDISFRWHEPDDPLPDREQRLHSIRNPNPHYERFTWMVSDKENKIVGTAGMGFENDSSPSYESNKHTCGGRFSVLPEYRRQGLGTFLLGLFLNKAQEHNKTIIQTSSPLESGWRFNEDFLGGKPAITGGEHRMYLEEVDWEMISQWQQEGKERNPDTSITFFEICPEEIIEEYCHIYSETMNQQPLGEMEWEYKATPESRRMDEERMAKQGIKWYTAITKEKDDRISGLTEMFYNTKREFKLGQNLTGVIEEERGRGLGKWLKAEMLLKMHDAYPDVKYVSTGNADDNAAMLSINTRMGFKKHKENRAYKYQVNDLLKQLEL